MLWCALLLAAGTAVGLHKPSPWFLPVLVAAIAACTVLRTSRHWHDVLTLLVWFLLGCCRASTDFGCGGEQQWKLTFRQKAKDAQTMLTARLERAGVSAQTLAQAEALTIGKKDNLTHATKQSYRQVGASHLLALSGMHLGIVYGVLYLLLVRPLRQSRWRWHVLPPVLLCLWGYALVAGMPVSLVRAALMFSILTILSLMQYDTDGLHPLSLSAIIILLIAPAQLLDISFQLSFAAVFFLMTLWQPLGAALPHTNWLLRLLLTSCIAGLGTMPLVAYYFHRISLLGPPISLVLSPLTTLIIYLSLAAMALPAMPLGLALNKLVGLQEQVLNLAGSLSFAQLDDMYPSAFQTALVYAVLVVAIVRLRTSPVAGRMQKEAGTP